MNESPRDSNPNRVEDTGPSPGSTEGTAKPRSPRRSTVARPLSRQTPWEIAESWYSEAEIAEAIQRQRKLFVDTAYKVPTDVYSEEFARWLTNEYRCAMAKGVQLARQGKSETDEG